MDDVVDRISAWLENDEADGADQTLRDARAEIIGLRARLATKDTFSDEDVARWRESMNEWMEETTNSEEISRKSVDDLRDTFAAAALTGLYANRAWDDSTDAAIAEQAYAAADAMLRERAKLNHDAAPAATAVSDEDRTDKAEPSHRRDRPGDTPSESEIDALEFVVVNGHTASVYDYGLLRQWIVRLRPEFDRPEPINDGHESHEKNDENRVFYDMKSTPASHATPVEGTSQSECWFRHSRNTDGPVAWGIECDGELLAAYTCEDEESAAAMVERFAATGMTGHVVVPLYRATKAAWQLVHDNERLRDEVMLLKDAIRRLAEQDATLSVYDGNVTVEMDATLTDAEREAVAYAEDRMDGGPVKATLRVLLERTQ